MFFHLLLWASFIFFSFFSFFLGFLDSFSYSVGELGILKKRSTVDLWLCDQLIIVVQYPLSFCVYFYPILVNHRLV